MGRGLNFCVRGLSPPTSCKRLHHFVFLFFSVCVAACFCFALSSDTTGLFRMPPPPPLGKSAWPLPGKASWYRVALASQLINPQSCTLSGNGRWEGWVLRNSGGGGEEKVRGRGVGGRKVGWGWGEGVYGNDQQVGHKFGRSETAFRKKQQCDGSRRWSNRTERTERQNPLISA